MAWKIKGKTIAPMDVVSNIRVEEMSITSGVQARSISCDDFHLLDYEVMGIVFSIHRDLGRFCIEKIYQIKILLMVLPQMVLPFNKA